MSFVDADSGNTDMEENPEPEEDSGLPQRYELEGEASEEEHAEEDLGMIQNTVSTDSQSMPNNGNNNMGIVTENTDNMGIVIENTANTENSAVNTINNNPENIVVLDSGGPRVGKPEQNHISVTQTNEYFLKEGGNALIAVCGNDVKCEVTETVETTLCHSHDHMFNHNQCNTLQTENGILKRQMSDSESDLRDLSTESFKNNLDVIDLSQIVDAASESADGSVSTEDSLGLSTGQGALVVIENAQQNSSSVSLAESFEVAEADLYVPNNESIPYAMSSVQDKGESVVCNMQNLECKEQSIPDNTMTKADELIADETASLAQVLPNNISDETTSLAKVLPDNISNETTSLAQVLPDNIADETTSPVQVLPDNIADETISLAKVLPDNISDETTSLAQVLPDNISGETTSLVQVLPDNISNETVSLAQVLPDNIAGETTSLAQVLPDNIADETTSVGQVLPDNIADEITGLAQVLPDNIADETTSLAQVLPDNIADETTSLAQVLPDNISGETTSLAQVLPDNIADEITGLTQVLPDNIADETTRLAQVLPDNIADETTSLVQVLPDNFSGFPGLTAKDNTLNAGQEPVLAESVMTGDNCVNFSPPVKSRVSAYDVQTCVSEHQRVSALADTEHNTISKAQDAQQHARSSLIEGCLHRPIDIILQQNITSCDYSNHSHLPQTESQHSQQNGHLESDQNCPHDTFRSHIQVLEYSSQDYYSDSSSSSPVVSSCSAALNTENLKSNHVFEFSSEDSSPAPSQRASPSKVVPSAMTTKFSNSGNGPTSAVQTDLEDEVFSDLYTELHNYTSQINSPLKTSPDKKARLSDSRLSGKYINGLQSPFEVNQIQIYNKQLLKQLQIRDEEIAKLTSKLNSVGETRTEVHSWGGEYQLSPSHQADDLYLPQIKVLEHTIAQQQREIQELKGKLISQDNSAKRAITTLQHELKSRVEQVTKLYEECRKEKDMIVVRFAESEAKHIEARRRVEKSEAKVKEAMRDKDLMMNASKAAKADKQRALTNFEMKCIEVSNMQKEIEKLKEALNSSEHRIKWFQSKLKDELESHKETKNNLEKITAKLKEAREETELIRKECQAIVKRYQECEEIKSNSLDKELKLKETELKTQIQEMSDTEEIHQMLKKELDSLKAQHKDVIEEVKIYKDKVDCLEEERRQNHQMIENYQEIMQRQKSSIAELNIKITSLSALDDNYQRSQDIIQTLQKEVADLQMTNQDVEKDMESCSERESKMLTLQSELSHTSALLRSENTSLSNKILSLTSEVEKRKMEVHTLEASVRDLSDKCDKEKIKRKEEGEKMAAILSERTKECNDLRQKWEDEMDSRKTLKRQHASNIKDLTRQLHQMHKRLESIEGKGDASSMGSRTNSNGSLNSLENYSRQSFPANHAPAQEFPAITEQIEVDKQVLIERIVRLQKSLARKNEKLEFLGEHVQQLLEDIRKKTKIIQIYALREESGTLTSEDMDANKAKVQKEMQALLTRKGGIMASLYSAHQQDGTMTLELSLQISRKLQAVLEDTLLKNITLKESLDTLGEEIARLSQENRRMQLHLQKLEGNLA